MEPGLNRIGFKWKSMEKGYKGFPIIPLLFWGAQKLENQFPKHPLGKGVNWGIFKTKTARKNCGTRATYFWKWFCGKTFLRDFTPIGFRAPKKFFRGAPQGGGFFLGGEFFWAEKFLLGAPPKRGIFPHEERYLGGRIISPKPSPERRAAAPAVGRTQNLSRGPPNLFHTKGTSCPVLSSRFFRGFIYFV